MADRDWKLLIYFTAADAEAAGFYDRIETAASSILGCTNGDHVCPHFQFSAMRPLRSSRRLAIRCALLELWAAITRGEVG